MAQTARKTRKGPGKFYREGISMLDLAEMFPDEAAATKWFERIMWGEYRPCPHCGSLNTRECKNHKPMPYRCRDCREHFSVRTRTVLERSHIPLKKWVWAIYLWTTSLKGVAAMKLHRDLKISYKSAWFMVHRLRECFTDEEMVFDGPVEVDEVWIGGKRQNMHEAQRAALTGRGGSGKVAVVGIKDRDTNLVDAQVVGDVKGVTLRRFVTERTTQGTRVYTDEANAYKGLPNHEAVNHSVGEYVKGQAHTNGIESFWALLRRGQIGVYHKISYKHLQRYINEFAARHNFRRMSTKAQMAQVVAAMVGQRLMYRELTRPTNAETGFLTSS